MENQDNVILSVQCSEPNINRNVPNLHDDNHHVQPIIPDQHHPTVELVVDPVALAAEFAAKLGINSNVGVAPDVGIDVAVGANPDCYANHNAPFHANAAHFAHSAELHGTTPWSPNDGSIAGSVVGNPGFHGNCFAGNVTFIPAFHSPYGYPIMHNAMDGSLGTPMIPNGPMGGSLVSPVSNNTSEGSVGSPVSHNTSESVGSPTMQNCPMDGNAGAPFMPNGACFPPNPALFMHPHQAFFPIYPNGYHMPHHPHLVTAAAPIIAASPQPPPPFTSAASPPPSQALVPVPPQPSGAGVVPPPQPFGASMNAALAAGYVQNPSAFEAQLGPYYVAIAQEWLDCARKIFCGGLSQSTDEKKLLEYLLERYQSKGWMRSDILECFVKVDAATKRSRGFGFVKFATQEMVQRVINDGPHIVDGKILDLKQAVPHSHTMKEEFAANPKKMFVGGIPNGTSEEMMKEFFGCFGLVESVIVLRKNDNNQNRGFGFVTFCKRESADKALGWWKFHGKDIECRRSVPKYLLQARDGQMALVNAQNARGKGQNQRQNGGQGNRQNGQGSSQSGQGNHQNGGNFHGNGLTQRSAIENAPGNFFGNNRVPMPMALPMSPPHQIAAPWGLPLTPLMASPIGPLMATPMAPPMASPMTSSMASPIAAPMFNHSVMGSPMRRVC